MSGALQDTKCLATTSNILDFHKANNVLDNYLLKALSIQMNNYTHTLDRMAHFKKCVYVHMAH